MSNWLLLISEGSSPRMRGAPPLEQRLNLVIGIIPAYAGSTKRFKILRDCITGSSPRMRGALHHLRSAVMAVGIIPAYAGSTPCSKCGRLRSRDHPRVCGEHAESLNETNGDAGSSPRMRGALGNLPFWSALSGIIPAYAGSTLKNPSSESRNPIIELHFNQFAKKVKRCFAIRFRPMRHFIVKAQ